MSNLLTRWQKTQDENVCPEEVLVLLTTEKDKLFSIEQLPNHIERQIRIQATNANKEVSKLHILKTVKDYVRSKGLWLADMQEVYSDGLYVTILLMSKVEMEYGLAH